MAGSKYAYVRSFELPDPLLPTTFFVIRLDGKGFHGFSKAHNFAKPNDPAALQLMNRAAMRTMQGKELGGECVIAFGESDEYSFVFRNSCKLHGRRASKLVSLVTSLFTSAYMFFWPQFFPNSSIQVDELPVFDGRIVQYTTELEVKDYLRWRQVDTHINNMYNTCFWALVNQGGLTAQDANKELSNTVSSQKQELLFSQFGINYNNLEPMFRKGSTLIWAEESVEQAKPERIDLSPNQTVDRKEVNSREPADRLKASKQPKAKRKVVVIHEDLINDAWWISGAGHGILN